MSTNWKLSDITKEFSEKYNLEEISHIANSILEKHKTILLNTLRYFGNGNVVPIEIEAVTKHHFLKNNIIEVWTEYLYEGLTFVYTKIEQKDNSWIYTYKHIDGIRRWNTVSWAAKRWNTYTVERERKENLLLFYYDNKIYREIPDAGNVYIHTKKQWEDLKRFLELDKEAWFIDHKTIMVIQIINTLHDIAEWLGEWDQITELKDTHDNEEEIINKLLLEEFGEEKSLYLIKILEQCEQKNSYFKLFERIRYLTSDLESVITNKRYTNKYHVLYFCLLTYIAILEETRVLPDGSKHLWKDIPSIKHECKGLEHEIERYLSDMKSFQEKWLIWSEYSYKVFGKSFNYDNIKKIRDSFISYRQ